MSRWTNAELASIGQAQELQIAPAWADGSLRRGTPIWVVRIGDNLYVRSYRGHHGNWFRAAQRSHEGEINAGGVSKRVRFVESDDAKTADAIDEAYRAKYRRYGVRYVDPMLASKARTATLQLVPVGDNE
jgi:hypothetical protein